MHGRDHQTLLAVVMLMMINVGEDARMGIPLELQCTVRTMLLVS